MKRFYEKKDHLIRKNPNLTDEEKQEIIELLGKHPSYENKIDWNKSNSLTYEDFLEVLRPLYINDLDPRGLIKGEDYDILYESEDEVLYSVYTHNASKILASNAVEPKMWTKIPFWCGEEEFNDEAHAFGHFDSKHGDMKPGAKWCISMQTSDRYWNQYNPDFHFFFWFSNNRLGSNRKIAISLSKSTWEIAEIYNGADKEIKMELPSYIMKAIDKKRKNYKEKELNRLKSMFTLNPQTNRYDYDGNLYRDILSNFVSEDRDGFIINFGKVTGNFDCSIIGLKSLKGAPQEVGGCFSCYKNQLTSLKGAPQTVGGTFWCRDNKLTSLKGAPQKVGGNFSCSNNQFSSLEGAPQEVGGWFDCSSNKLISLEGVPQKVIGDFDCSYNQLTSLKGAPTEVGGDFNCSGNELISLEGAPKEVGNLTKRIGSFYCSRNQLTSLKGAPNSVGFDFYCKENKLTSLKGAPQIIGRDFCCEGNPNLHSLDGIGEVRGDIYKDF